MGPPVWITTPESASGATALRPTCSVSVRLRAQQGSWGSMGTCRPAIADVPVSAGWWTVTLRSQLNGINPEMDHRE
jgi:hypothetical protein